MLNLKNLSKYILEKIREKENAKFSTRENISLTKPEGSKLAEYYTTLPMDQKIRLEEMGTKVVFYVNPYRNGKPAHGKDIILNELDAIDMAPVLDEYGEEIWLDYSHLTPDGNLIVANLFHEIINNLLEENSE
jgi:hypothetical protein